MAALGLSRLWLTAASGLMATLTCPGDVLWLLRVIATFACPGLWLRLVVDVPGCA